MSKDEQELPAGPVGRLVGRLTARPALTLVALLGVSIAAAWWGSGIEIRSDMEDLLPDTAPAVERAREAREAIGSKSKMWVLLGSDGPDAGRAVAKRLAEGVARHTDLVGSVEYRREVQFFEDNALLYMPVEDLKEFHERVETAIQDQVRKELSIDDDFDFDDEDEDEDEAAGADGAEPQKEGVPDDDEIRRRYGIDELGEYFETPDGKVISVKIYPTFKPAEAGKTKKLKDLVVAEVEAAIAEAAARGDTITYGIEGNYSGVSESVDQIKSDLGRATGVALAGIVLLLLLWFRRLRAVLVVVVPLLVGLMWTAFFARATIGYLNLITPFIFAILVGLGIDFVVHGASRVDEAFDGGQPLRQALARGLGALGRPMLAAAATTVATFASLAIFDFRGFSQFGILAAGGVILCLFSVYVVLPPLMTAMNDLVTRKRRGRKSDPAAASAKVSAKPARPSGNTRGIAIFALVTLLATTGLAGAQLPSLQFENDLSKMRPKKTKKDSELKTKYRAEAEKRMYAPALYLTGSLEETRALHNHLDALKETEPRINHVGSIFSFIPEDQEVKLPIIKEIKRRIDAKYGILEGEDQESADRVRPYLEPTAFGVDELPGWVRDKFTDLHGGFGRYVVVHANGQRSNGEDVVKIEEAIGKIDLDGKSYYATASFFMTGEIYKTVLREGPNAVLIALLVVLLFLIIDLRGVRSVILAFVPLVCGFVIFLAILAGLDIPLNIFNIVVLPTIFGISVDTAIHLVHRLREGVSLGTALRTTGGAAGISAATTMVGFASLLMVSNPGLQTIGSVAVIGVATTFATATIMISAMVAMGWPVGSDGPAKASGLEAHADSHPDADAGATG